MFTFSNSLTVTVLPFDFTSCIRHLYYPEPVGGWGGEVVLIHWTIEWFSLGENLGIFSLRKLGANWRCNWAIASYFPFLDSYQAQVEQSELLLRYTNQGIKFHTFTARWVWSKQEAQHSPVNTLGPCLESLKNLRIIEGLPGPSSPVQKPRQ